MFPPSVELWHDLLTRYAGDLPVPFLKAWIEKESYGKPCSWTTLREAGIFQLMYGSNQNVAGTSEAALRAACAGETQTQTRPLTEAEAVEHVRSGVQYVRWCREYARKKLAAAGVTWSESSPDFGRMVMFVHILPGKIAPWLAAARAGLGHPPRSWNELVPFASSVGISAKWVQHATWIGGHWTPTPIPLIVGMIAGGAGLLYYLWRRR